MVNNDCFFFCVIHIEIGGSEKQINCGYACYWHNYVRNIENLKRSPMNGSSCGSASICAQDPDDGNAWRWLTERSNGANCNQDYLCSSGNVRVGRRIMLVAARLLCSQVTSVRLAVLIVLILSLLIIIRVFRRILQAICFVLRIISIGVRLVRMRVISALLRMMRGIGIRILLAAV